MKKIILHALTLALSLSLLAGCAPLSAPTQTPQLPAVAPTKLPESSPAPDELADKVAALLAQLSPAQKVGQLLVAGLKGPSPDEDGRAALEDYQVGGVILFSRNVESVSQLADLTNQLKRLNGDHIPLFLCIDQEGGRVSRMPPEITPLPSALDFGRQKSPTLCYSLGATLGTMCSSFGLNMDFAPCLDIWSNVENTVIGDRALGTGWGPVTELGLAELQGFMSTKTIPVVKHFPGHGDTTIDSHKTLPIVTKTLPELLQSELVPFRTAVTAGAPCVMVSHLLLEQIDPQYPATLSQPVVTGVLRETLGFDGVVVTDDLTMAALTESYTVGQAAVLAVNAGCDLLLVCHEAENLQEVHKALMDALADGTISQERLDKSVERILTLKLKSGITAKPITAPDVAALNAQIEAIIP